MDDSQGSGTVTLSAEELRAMLEDVVLAATSDVEDSIGGRIDAGVTSLGDRVDAGVSSLGASIGSYASSSASGVVTLDSSQFRQLRADFASSTYALVVAVGVLSLVLGAVIALGFTSHWRSRG